MTRHYLMLGKCSFKMTQFYCKLLDQTWIFASFTKQIKAIVCRID